MGGITSPKLRVRLIPHCGFRGGILRDVPQNHMRLHIFQWFDHFWNTLVLYGIRTGEVMLIN